MKRICEVEGCGLKHYAKGKCVGHWRRAYYLAHQEQAVDYGRKHRAANREQRLINQRRFRRSETGKYKMLREKSKKRGQEMSLSLDEFKSLLSEPCFYCGGNTASETGYSLDRKDNTIGYRLSNCVPCCRVCNQMKSNLSMEVFLEKVSAVQKYQEAKCQKGYSLPELVGSLATISLADSKQKAIMLQALTSRCQSSALLR